MPAYGGNLFDPDRFAFLEGRPPGTSWHDEGGAPIPVTDLDVLAILDALLYLAELRQHLSYRNVDVEQVGHIYERLLDHDAVVADKVVLGLQGKKGEEPEIALSDLEARRIDGDTTLIAWLSNKDAAKAGRYVATKGQLEKKLATAIEPRLRAGLLQACQGNATLAARIEPYASLLRLDLRERPLVFLEGAVFVTETGSRRDSGTAYTTKELADEVAEHALAPLCYSPGPQDTSDTNEWDIRSSAQILALKVCDPAVGSGAILVAACRYLAERVVEAWRAEGDPAALDLATAADDPSRLDVVVKARRLVAEHCCYGVDRNPMAVEMAKLSMWLTTVAKDRPFTFLDHAIKSGDSLLGIWDLNQLRHLHYDVSAGLNRATPIPGFDTGGDAITAVNRLVNEAISIRHELADIDTLRPNDVEHKAKLHAASEKRLAVLATIADVLTGAAISTAGASNPTTALAERIGADAIVVVDLVHKLGTVDESPATAAAQQRAQSRLDAGRPDGAPSRRPLHWPVAFPEVFADSRSGFDAMVGNPPFIGGQKITGAAGTDYRDHLIAWIANGAKGSADLVAYFFLDAMKVAQSFGFLATNTIAQGDTSEVGLTQIIDSGWTVHQAVSSTAWPGDATLEIAKIWATSDQWNGVRSLDGRSVVAIDEMLYPASRSAWRKRRLAANANKSFIGSYVLGMGFTMSPEEALALIDTDQNNADVLFPYLGGEDLNQSPTQTAPRWIINFFDWSEDRARSYRDCFSIVEETVKPERQERKPNGDFKKRKPLPQKYWIYAEKRPAMYRTIAPLERVLAIARVSKAATPVFVTNDQVLSEQTVAFAFDDDHSFGMLTSNFHYRWAHRHTSTHESRIRYAPSDVFETFPFAPVDARVVEHGAALDHHRSATMIDRDIGLTDVYNLVHDSGCHEPEIKKLRAIHRRLDLAVRDAYGWSDLELGHGFHEVRGQGVRYTFSADAADEILDRLLELNKERYEAEVADGLHGGSKKTSKRQRAAKNQPSLLGEYE